MDSWTRKFTIASCLLLTVQWTIADIDLIDHASLHTQAKLRTTIMYIQVKEIIFDIINNGAWSPICLVSCLLLVSFAESQLSWFCIVLRNTHGWCSSLGRLSCRHAIASSSSPLVHHASIPHLSSSRQRYYGCAPKLNTTRTHRESWKNNTTICIYTYRKRNKHVLAIAQLQAVSSRSHK